MPELERHTAIIVSDLKNDWTAAFNCYILCVQAGLNPVFIRPDRDDPAPYLLLIAPSLHGSMPISVTAWNKITEAVRNGATLYVSGAGISLRNMKELFGIAEMEMFPQETCRADIRFRDFTCSISANYRNRFHVFDAEVSARYPDGTPIECISGGGFSTMRDEGGVYLDYELRLTGISEVPDEVLLTPYRTLPDGTREYAEAETVRIALDAAG